MQEIKKSRLSWRPVCDVSPLGVRSLLMCLEKQQKAAQGLGPLPCGGAPEEAPGFWLQTSPALATAANKYMGKLSPPQLCLSSKQILKTKAEQFKQGRFTLKNC